MKTPAKAPAKDPPKGKVTAIEVHLDSPHAEHEARMRFPPKTDHADAVAKYKKRFGIRTSEHPFICEPVYEESAPG